MHRSDIQPSAKGLHLSGKLLITEPMGYENIVHVQLDGITLRAITPATTSFETNETVAVRFNEDYVHVFSKKDEGRAII
jgi:ABC-type sugar transport system ATPase subunit